MPKKARHGGHHETLSHAQLLDESFECMNRTAQSMCVTLGRPKDRLICRQTLLDLATYNKSESTEVKHNVRTFLRLYLKALRWTQINQPMTVYEKWVSKWVESWNTISIRCIIPGSLAIHVTTQVRIHPWPQRMKYISGLRVVDRIWPWNILMTVRRWSIRRCRMSLRLVGWMVVWKNYSMTRNTWNRKLLLYISICNN